MKNFLIIFGTRPEAIKMAPVIRELQNRAKVQPINVKVCVTAQHREMLDQVLRLFGITPDYDLNIMEENQTPTQVASAVLTKLETILLKEKPDWVLVQGDTTTVAAASLAAFYAGVRVGHVEAGLRTHDKWRPFPEEINRRVAGVTADLHFAPTQHARANLLREGVPEECIVVTGNPVIDALYWVASLPFDVGTLNIERSTFERDNVKLLLVTAHRRENFGQPLENICLALRNLANHYNNQVRIIYPVHLNPNVWKPVHQLLSGFPNIALIPPLDYLPLVHVMKHSYLILTDSGGIQEEAPGFGKPVLVLREKTERPEAVEAGTVKVVGTDKERIITEASLLIDWPEEYEKMAKAVNPYGDGKASQRIVSALLGEPISPFISNPV